jgi:3-hydroxyacyl-[acyl-carrier-protein] dehydratase
MPPKAIVEFDQFPQETVADIEAIRKINPQRLEMEQVTAITKMDFETGIMVGYKDVTPNEFWVKGHMPFFALMPGVLMLEAAAQMGSYFCRRQGHLIAGDFIGLGGMDRVRFRGVVRPGDRLWIVGRIGKPHTRRMAFEFQGFVNGKMVFEAEMLGIPLDTKKAFASSEQ